MKDSIRSILLIIAIYSGAAAANSHDVYVYIPMSLLCGVVCAIYTQLIKGNKED